jgi:hypothetical protein
VPKLWQEQNSSKGPQIASMQVWWYGMGSRDDHDEKAEEKEEGFLGIVVFLSLITSLGGQLKAKANNRGRYDTYFRTRSESSRSARS